MKIIYIPIILLFISFSAYADGGHLSNANTKQPEVSASIINNLLLESGKDAEVTIKMIKKDGSAILPDDLKIVHTQNIHALIIDASLTDYSHKHPIPNGNPGEYKFTFKPKTQNNYKLWLEVTPVNSPHQYIMLNLSPERTVDAEINKKEIFENTITKGADKYKFSLTFDDKVAAGKAAMGRINVTNKDNKEFKNLQPVMGAFAHIVGFYDDYKNIVHIHPMGKEPESEVENGGPDLIFHIEPDKKGFLKLFAQVKINGEELFVPFGVNVE